VVFRVLRENAEQGREKKCPRFVAKVKPRSAEESIWKERLPILEGLFAKYPQNSASNNLYVKSGPQRTSGFHGNQGHALEESGQFSEQRRNGDAEEHSP